MENQNNEINKDTLFATQFESVKAFAFDQQVTDVFADMIKRSVPGYETILKSIAMYCMRYGQNGSHIYDLGCSLGAVSVIAAEATIDKNCHIIAVDTSDPMLNTCRKIIESKNLADRVSVLKQDIVDMPMENASVVVSNFTLQFIPKVQRLGVVKNIYNALNAGGVFILSEKIKADTETDAFLIEYYHAYKKLNGYSNKEIQTKRQALKDVLIPDNIMEIENRLKSAGFDVILKWFQCFNFASFIAIKKQHD